ncbi:hypothetical protein [Bradyrhizobium sp. STM 3843]|uniref:hypothetical protein n=1 Tax=Bradyrhizobium sp. STM 3843 TaxID=551947 RepID=UPI001586884F|nr:hypothetical protein [Bradyrhizobium sp. STM 3843]
MGAASARHSLRLCFKGRSNFPKLGRDVRRENGVSYPQAQWSCHGMHGRRPEIEANVFASENIKNCLHAVMAGLVPAIHVFGSAGKEDVDARVKPGHDDDDEQSKRSSPHPRWAGPEGPAWPLAAPGSPDSPTPRNLLSPRQFAHFPIDGGKRR